MYDKKVYIYVKKLVIVVLYPSWGMLKHFCKYENSSLWHSQFWWLEKAFVYDNTLDLYVWVEKFLSL